MGHGWAGPAVVGSQLILFHRVGDEDVVECLDAATGKQTWKSAYHTRYVDDFNFDNGPRATPLIAAGRIYTLGADGDFRAGELESGKAIWKRRTSSRTIVCPKGFFGAATSPLLVDGKLLINVGVKGAGVVAFDPANGKEIWKAGNDAVSYSSPIVGKLGDEELAIFFTRQGLLALVPKTGQVPYQYPWRARISASGQRGNADCFGRAPYYLRLVQHWRR